MCEPTTIKLSVSLGSAPSSPLSSSPLSPSSPLHSPSSPTLEIPIPFSVPRIDTRRARTATRGGGERHLCASSFAQSLDSHTAHLAKFKKSKRAYSVATSKADTVLTKEILPHPVVIITTPSSSSSPSPFPLPFIPNLPTHLSVANLKAAFEQQRSKPIFKRVCSEPCFHSWDFGYTDDVFAAEYDISPAISERGTWEEDIKDIPPPPQCTSLPPSSKPPTMDDSSLLLGEKKAGKQDIIFRTTESGKSAVVAGTLGKLVQYLASEELPDTNYIKMFILTFHRFMTSVELLNKLITNFKNPSTIKTPPTDPVLRDNIYRIIRSRIINVLKLWLFVCPDDLHYGDTAGIFAAFLMDLQTSTSEERAMANSLSNALMTEGRIQSPPSSPTAAVAAKKSGILPRPKSVVIRVEQFLDASPKEFAKQLTLIDQEMMRSINPRDLMEKSRDKTKVSPLVEISKRFDQVSTWVTSEVVSTPHHKQRTLVVTNFVHLIEELIKLNNFHSAMSVYLGLGATPCTRLKDTWKSLSRKILEKWEHLEAFMSPSFNFKKLRFAIANASRPIIPPLTVLVKDLTFMEENAELYPADTRLINFEKISLIGQLLVDIHECGVASYDLEVIPPVRDYLTQLFVLSEEKIELASKSAMRAATRLAQNNPRAIHAETAMESPRSRIAKRRSIMRFFVPGDKDD